MTQLSNVVRAVTDLLRGEGGLQSNIDSMTGNDSSPVLKLAEYQLITQNLAADIIDRSVTGKYPRVHVYCEKAINLLREKFRTFSGTVGIVVEIRVSTDRVEELDAQMSLVIDAVTATLDQNRGDWGGGVFYGGAYEIVFAPVKQGGKNFIQTSKITFDLDVSRN